MRAVPIDEPRFKHCVWLFYSEDSPPHRILHVAFTEGKSRRVTLPSKGMWNVAENRLADS